ncbi:MAG: carbohydrate porin [Planctomycetota bacterium]|jgi:hypothetical protein
MAVTASAEEQQPDPNDNKRVRVYTDSFDDPTEPSNLLSLIDQRREQKDSVFPVSPLKWLHDETGKVKKDIYDATGIKLGFLYAQVFQGVSEALPGQDDWGTASTLYLLGSWDLINKEKPTMGQMVILLDGRWDYGTTGPEELGTFSLGSVIGTADTFSRYTPTFIVRDLYWRQGSPEAKWVYRIGKITPDALLGSSAHLSSESNFLTSGGTGPFAIALPDSGLGAVGALYFSDRVALAGLLSDGNADRFDFGDIDEGDLFVAAELQVKIAPKTPKAGYSKLTIWHTDGTKDGLPTNAEAGPSGWGVFVKHEQELTDDGRAIGILRYGKSFNDSAVYEQQAGAHLLLYEPRFLTWLKNDLIGTAFNWASASLDNTRSEYNVEVFYRFPLFPNVDTTLSYQSVINPAFNRDTDHASVLSFRIRTVF